MLGNIGICSGSGFLRRLISRSIVLKYSIRLWEMPIASPRSTYATSFATEMKAEVFS